MFERPIICHRLFFALVPPLALARQIVAATAILQCRAMIAERLHMTMFILDDLPRVDPVLIAALRAIGGSVRIAPIEVTLDRIVGSDRSIALRPSRAHPSLGALHREIANHAKTAGITERQGYRFSPHMTLGYDNPVPRSERVAPIGWTASELVLIHSRVGQTRHEPLCRWPLAGTTTAQLALF